MTVIPASLGGLIIVLRQVRYDRVDMIRDFRKTLVQEAGSVGRQAAAT